MSLPVALVAYLGGLTLWGAGLVVQIDGRPSGLVLVLGGVVLMVMSRFWPRKKESKEDADGHHHHVDPTA